MSGSLQPSTIRTYLAGLRAWFISAGFDPPSMYTQRVKWAIRAVERTAPLPVPVQPFNMAMLRAVYHSTPYSYDNLCLFSALLLGYFGCLRSSEYLYTSHAPHLAPAHLTYVPATVPYFTIAIQSSKTAHRGFSLVIGCAPEPPCPVCWLASYLQNRPPSPRSPLFTLQSGLPVSRRILTRFMRDSLTRAGLDSSRISTHSLRAGAATDAAGQGFSDAGIQALGRWRSNAFAHYIRPTPDQLAANSSRLVSHSAPSTLRHSHPPSTGGSCTYNA